MDDYVKHIGAIKHIQRSTATNSTEVECFLVAQTPCFVECHQRWRSLFSKLEYRNRKDSDDYSPMSEEIEVGFSIVVPE